MYWIPIETIESYWDPCLFTCLCIVYFWNLCESEKCFGKKNCDWRIAKLIQPLNYCLIWRISFNHSHKKRKDSLEGSLHRVLLAAELEFPKILVPRLPQHTSDVNTECAGKSEWSKQLFLTCDQLFEALIHLSFIILILICFYLWCLM